MIKKSSMLDRSAAVRIAALGPHRLRAASAAARTAPSAQSAV